MTFNRKIVGDYFEKFSTTTVLRVFNFIRTSRFLFERLFWIVVLLGFSYTTVSDVVQTFTTFAAEPTASRVMFVSNTTVGIRFEQAIFCMQMRTDMLLKLYENNVDEVIANVVNKDDFMQRLTQKINKIHESEDDRTASLVDAIANRTSAAPQLLSEYHRFEESTIGMFSSNEVALLGVTSAMFARLVDLEIDPKLFYPSWQSRAVERLFQAYVNKGTDFSALLSIVSEMTCVLFQIRLSASLADPNTGVNNYTAWNFCKRFSRQGWFGIFFAGTELICYHATKGYDSPFVFNTQYDFVTLTMHPEALYREATPELHRITLDPEGTMSTDQQALSPRFNDKQTVEFSLETLSTRLNLRRRACSEKENRRGVYMHCLDWCRVESIVEACGCMPLLRQLVPEFAQLPKNVQSCAIRLGANYNSPSLIGDKCLTLLAHSYPENCSELQCNPDCETAVFSSTVRSSDSSLAYLNASTVVNFVSTKFVYEKVDEYLTMTSKTLVASLGGNLSLYLGASFLALIHIIVFFVKLPFELAFTDTSPEEVTPSAKSEVVDLNSSRVKEELKRMMKGLVDEEVSSLRHQVRVLSRRLELVDLDRKLLRGALLLNGGQVP